MIAEADVRSIGVPARRAATIRQLAKHVADGALDLAPGADRHESASALLAIDGIGPWTVEYVLMRALRDPDRFPAADLIVRQQLGSPEAPLTAHQAAAAADAWRPWRSYALMHLWQPAPPAALVQTERRLALETT